MIDERENLPSSSAYRSRFGSLVRAYELIGYNPERDFRYIEINRFLRHLYGEQVSAVVAAIEGVGASVERDERTNLLSINGEFTASVVVARCLQTEGGRLRWKIRFDTSLRPNITIAIRMAEDNREVRDYYFLPRIDFPMNSIRMVEENGLHLNAYRADTLEPFFRLTARASIRRVA